MLGLLSCDTVDFEEEVTVMATAIGSEGIGGWVQQEAQFIQQRAEVAKQAKIEGLVEQLKGLASPEQLQQLAEQAMGSASGEEP